jgi:CPA2 family monovalent cation:H+ antiporter-2
VVLLRGLVDNGLLNTPHGQVAVGWLVLEDLATVAILVLLPALFGEGEGGVWQTGGIAILQTAVFVAIMLFIGKRFMPWLLTRIAHTRSRELFILAVVALALGTALGAAELFGVSLALGAFLAGVVIGESEVSHQVGAEVLPFREIFAVLFFVSVGMLVNPAALLANAGQVVALTLLIVVGKALVTLLFATFLPAPLQTMLVVSAGLSQIGEFSFLVGQAALSLGVLNQDQYGLILAGALLSIIVNPLLFRAIPHVQGWFQQHPGLHRFFDRHSVPPQPVQHEFDHHVVVVGFGRVGEHIVRLLQQLQVPHLVIEQDAARASAFQQRGVPTLFGDAANSELLTHADLERARALVVTVPDETAAEAIVVTARDLAPNLPIIARSATREGTRRLAQQGAQDVINPELEGGLEIVRHTLLTLDYPMGQVQQYIDAVRQEAYDSTSVNGQEVRLLNQLVNSVRDMEIVWRPLTAHSPLVGLTLAEANLRAHTGASIVALLRDKQVVANPKSHTRLKAGDVLALIGDAEQIAAAEQMIRGVDTPPQPRPIDQPDLVPGL